MKQQKTLSVPKFCAVYIAVIIACILLDQATKIWIFDGLLQSTAGTTVTLIPKLLSFSAVYNDGCVFGMLDGSGADIIFFIVTVAATPLYVVFLLRSRTRSVWGQIGFAFIVGGAIGNAIDRAFVHTSGTFFSGEVRDFISFSFFPPVFNVADSFLTVGVVMAILAVLFFDRDSVLQLYREEAAARRAVDTVAEPSEALPTSEMQNVAEAQASRQAGEDYQGDDVQALADDAEVIDNATSDVNEAKE